MDKALKEVQWLIKNTKQNIEGANRKIEYLFDTIEANQLEIVEREALLAELLQVEEAILRVKGELPAKEGEDAENEQTAHEGIPNKQPSE